MIGGDLGYAGTFTKVMVGITASSGAELAIFSGSKDGLDPVAAFPVSEPASNFNFGNFGDGDNDLAFLAGGKVEILRASTMKLQQVSLPVNATALALGSFVIDRAPCLQLALLTADGTIHIAAHNEFDPRAYSTDELKAIQHAAKLRTAPNPLLPARVFPANGWKIVEDIPAHNQFSLSYFQYRFGRLRYNARRHPSGGELIPPPWPGADFGSSLGRTSSNRAFIRARIGRASA